MMNDITRREFIRGLSAGAMGLAGGWAACARAAAATPERLNFILILADDLGWRDAGCYGSTFHQTPNIDRLAAQGMKFTNAYAACPVCSPTRASILTGKYPARLHLTDWIPGDQRRNARLLAPKWRKFLPLEEVTLPEALKPAGYVSGCVGKWHLGTRRFYPENQGFDLTVGIGGGTPRSYFSPYRNPRLPDGPKGEYLTDRLSDEAVKLVEANKDKPFFLYLPHHAVHTPIKAKAELISRYKARLAAGALPAGGPRGQKNPVYAAMVHSLDEGVGRLLDKLEELKIAERTVVIFFSDNGGLARVTSNAPLRAGKGTLYEGGIRGPMIVRWAGAVKPGSTCDEPVISTDFYPTLLEIAGVTDDPKATRDGVSIVPLLKQSGTIRREALYWHYPHYQKTAPGGAIRRGDHKLIEYYEDGRVELYDLKADVGERNNLAKKMPARAAELQKMLADWRGRVGAQMPTPNPKYATPAKRDKGRAKPGK